MRLLHYCCQHSAEKITTTLIPQHQPLLGVSLIWLTDLDPPDLDALGLRPILLRCDRIEYQVVVETEEAMPWTVWAHLHGVPLRVREGLDGSPGAKPRHWWVSEHPIEIIDIQRRK